MTRKKKRQKLEDQLRNIQYLVVDQDGIVDRCALHEYKAFVKLLEDRYGFNMEGDKEMIRIYNRMLQKREDLL